MSKRSKSAERILIEDALKHLYQCQTDGRLPSIEGVAGTLHLKRGKAAALIDRMAAHHLLVVRGDSFRLTPAGEEYALQVIRAHRLWERYLADETGFREGEWHHRADQQEHTISPAEADALAARLGHPTHDPHGDPIPTAQGEMPPQAGQPLTTLAPGATARIVHLEDEPQVVYAQLIAEGLSPNMQLEVQAVSATRIRFQAGGADHVLAPMVAANISVIPLPERQPNGTEAGLSLADLEPGQTGRVTGLSWACRGAERRRLMDLGILPGTVITAELRSPGGDPTGYQIRGALIALRREQAALIHISLLPEKEQVS